MKYPLASLLRIVLPVLTVYLLSLHIHAQQPGIQGKVFVQFVVEKDGSISDVNIIRGIGGGCDEEATRLVKNMPNWIPGKQRNMPVRVRFNMPIHFVLL